MLCTPAVCCCQLPTLISMAAVSPHTMCCSCWKLCMRILTLQWRRGWRSCGSAAWQCSCGQGLQGYVSMLGMPQQPQHRQGSSQGAHPEVDLISQLKWVLADRKSASGMWNATATSSGFGVGDQAAGTHATTGTTLSMCLLSSGGREHSTCSLQASGRGPHVCVEGP